jgi:hypothetical protein
MIVSNFEAANIAKHTGKDSAVIFVSGVVLYLRNEGSRTGPTANGKGQFRTPRITYIAWLPSPLVTLLY